ncbi:phosphatase PAP2 family protein [Muribaculaceae bacterium Isolate-013 (NCI)]|nr:phosphatase PAP2 family protein [Muribaculaceae bacterium Isolate-013 (NCI)]
MKKYALSLLRSSVCAFAVIFSASASFAQDAPAKKIKDHRTAPELFFLQEGDVPNSFMLLPAPPDGASITFLNDQARYNWGKTMRNTPRGELAFKDAHVEGNGVPQAFSEAFGVEINEETPEILKLVVGMREDAGDLGTREAKNYYNRQRPFSFYEEDTCNPEQQAELSTNGSYPSGHTSIGWATALVLAEINPERQNEILKRGYEMGESRVICGYHFQSDVDAGRITGAVTVARLHADPGFQAQLEKAKAEFKNLKKAGKVAKGTPVPTPTTTD